MSAAMGASALLGLLTGAGSFLSGVLLSAQCERPVITATGDVATQREEGKQDVGAIIGASFIGSTITGASVGIWSLRRGSGLRGLTARLATYGVAAAALGAAEQRYFVRRYE